MALLLMHANATVTICHSKTRDLPGVVRRADIVVAAMGRPGDDRADWVQPGATVIDVGINRVTDAAEAQRIFANFPANAWRNSARKATRSWATFIRTSREVAGAITPVPGGVGPLTIAMLMSNTVKAARLRRGRAATGVDRTEAGEASLMLRVGLTGGNRHRKKHGGRHDARTGLPRLEADKIARAK